MDDGSGGFNFGAKFHGLERNMCLVKEIAHASEDVPALIIDKMANRKDVVPYAVITQEDGWIERAQMGWWGISTNEKDGDTWKSEWKAIKEKYPDHLAVGLDCHI